MSRYVRTSGHRSGPIVVAVDRHDGDWSPLEWAASEAAARGRHLRIVCTVGSHPLMFDTYGVIAAQQWDASARRTGELVLQEATRRACDIDPHLRISTRLHVGFADAAVLREGQNAEMIVIGRGRDMGRLLAHSRSLSLRVARHANSSVVVIGPANRSCLLAPRRVVLGLDDPGAQAAALSCAFLAAHHADVPLDVLQRRPVPEVQDQMEMWRDVFPGVDVRQDFVGELLASRLVRASEGASLLVLSSGPSGFLHFSPFEAARRAVLRSARCPVAVIRTPFEVPRAGLGPRNRRSSAEWSTR